MKSIEYSTNAAERIVALCEIKQADEQVLDGLEQQLNILASHPELTNPIQYPHKGGTFEFEVTDRSGSVWLLSVVVSYSDTVMRVLQVCGGLSSKNFET